MAYEFGMISLVLIIQIFVLINPFSSFPFLISAHQKKINPKRIAIASVLTAYAIAVIIALTGPLLFTAFGITLDSFKIAGGIILLLLGIDMVRSKEEDHLKVDKKGDHLVTLIATPMLTGPATISFITLKAHEIGQASILINVTAAFIVVGVVFFAMAMFIDKLNQGFMNILSRIMGLFLTAVAVEMISTGLVAVLHVV